MANTIQIKPETLLSIGVKQPKSVAFAASFNKMFVKYGITTKEEAAALIATAQIETSFVNLIENMNYTSPERLCQVYKSYFTTVEQAKLYTNNPKKLADFVYASRGGYAFIGRGLVQLTGRANYESFKRGTGIDVIANPDLLCNDPDVATEALFWFFKSNNLLTKAKAKDWQGVRRGVNGQACLGYSEFLVCVNKLLEVI